MRGFNKPLKLNEVAYFLRNQNNDIFGLLEIKVEAGNSGKFGKV